MRREVLRVGKSKGKAVCILELAYLQTHGISGKLARHQREVVEAFLTGSGVRFAAEKEVVNCPASRNPAGVYTDNGGGVQREEYDVTGT